MHLLSLISLNISLYEHKNVHQKKVINYICESSQYSAILILVLECFKKSWKLLNDIGSGLHGDGITRLSDVYRFRTIKQIIQLSSELAFLNVKE